MTDFKHPEQFFIIAIDGPAGAGKSTIATQVAKKSALQLVDTGAIYRSLAYAALQKNIPLDSEEELFNMAENLDLLMNDQVIFLSGEDISDKIRQNEISLAASKISQLPKVRAALLGLQRQLGCSEGGAVLEGRDIGSIVFPHAQVKIFLTASIEERALRRQKELESRGQVVSYQQIFNDIKERDFQDMNRKVAPLIQTEDAHLVDTTGHTLEEVIAEILELIKKKRKINN